ncbi:hypothetical protein AB4555_00800 [Vibrio sp. 10N.222.54.B11]
MTAVDRVYQKIKRSRRYVFERKDFDVGFTHSPRARYGLISTPRSVL